MAPQVSALIDSLPALADVMTLAAFFLCVFAILGMQLFSGELRRRCFVDDGTVDGTGDGTGDGTEGGDGGGGGGDAGTGGSLTLLPIDADAGVCGTGGLPDGARGTCGTGQVCRDFGANPLHGTVSFDTFPEAAMTTYQCVTLEGWSDVMYMLQVRMRMHACTSTRATAPATAHAFATAFAFGVVYQPRMPVCTPLAIARPAHAISDRVHRAWLRSARRRRRPAPPLRWARCSSGCTRSTSSSRCCGSGAPAPPPHRIAPPSHRIASYARLPSANACTRFYMTR